MGEVVAPQVMAAVAGQIALDAADVCLPGGEDDLKAQVCPSHMAVSVVVDDSHRGDSDLADGADVFLHVGPELASVV